MIRSASCLLICVACSAAQKSDSRFTVNGTFDKIESGSIHIKRGGNAYSYKLSKQYEVTVDYEAAKIDTIKPGWDVTLTCHKPLVVVTKIEALTPSEKEKQDAANIQKKKEMEEEARLRKEYQPINCRNLRVGTKGILKEAVEIVNVVNDEELIVSCDDITLWLKGWSTEGMVDGKKVMIRDRIRVTGTKTYKTVLGGTKTVLLIEPGPKPKR